MIPSIFDRRGQPAAISPYPLGPAAGAAKSALACDTGVDADADEHDDSDNDDPTEAEVFSLPTWTPRDEAAERSTATAAELAAVESDLRGITSSLAATHLNGEKKKPEPTDLMRLEEAIEKLPLHIKAACLEAKVRCPEEVLCSGWRREAFLECTSFNAADAAAKVCDYWTQRLELFGMARAYMPMTLSGAMQDEVVGMMTYAMHRICPVRDEAGRLVIFAEPHRRDINAYSTLSQKRAYWYLLEVISQDEGVRNRGFVTLFTLSHSKSMHFDPKFVPWCEKTRDLFPVRQRSMHLCHPNMLVRYVITPAFKMMASREVRLRMTVHNGSVEQVLTSLAAYRLPRDRVPKELGGDVIIDDQAWINERYAAEGSDWAVSETVLVGGAATAMQQQQQVEPTTKRQRVTPEESSGQSQQRMLDSETALKSSSSSQRSRTMSLSSSQSTRGANEPDCFTAAIVDLLPTPLSESLSSPQSPDTNTSENAALPQCNAIQSMPLRQQAPRQKAPHSVETAEAEAPPPQKRKARTSKREGKPSPKLNCNDIDDSIVMCKNGRRADPRMNAAILVRLRNPDISAFDALNQGGFKYAEAKNGCLDDENISLRQRSNQLRRRVRQAREKLAKEKAEKADATDVEEIDQMPEQVIQVRTGGAAAKLDDSLEFPALDNVDIDDMLMMLNSSGNAE